VNSEQDTPVGSRPVRVGAVAGLAARSDIL